MSQLELLKKVPTIEIKIVENIQFYIDNEAKVFKTKTTEIITDKD